MASSLFSKQPADAAQDTVLLWVVWVVLGGDLEESWKGGSVGVDLVADAFCDLWWGLAGCSVPLYTYTALPQRPNFSRHPLIPPCFTKSAVLYGGLTCWLMSRMPMSFLSLVNLSNAASIAAVSVLESTTRKFFCESGGLVTCYLNQYSFAPTRGGTMLIHQCPQVRGQ